MSVQRAKGTAWESAIIDYLNKSGFDTERRALHGVNDCGDISGLRGVVVEAKNCKTMTLSTWIDEAEVERLNDDARFGVVWHHRRGVSSPAGGYVTMTGSTFVELLREGGW